MALNAKIDSTIFSNLPDHFKAEYKKDGDNYVLDVTAVDGLELTDAAGLQSALQKERTNVKELEKLLAPFRDGDNFFDVDSAREAMGQVERLTADLEEARSAQGVSAEELTRQADEKVKGKYESQIESFKNRLIELEQKAAAREGSLIDQIRDAKLDSQVSAILADPEIACTSPKMVKLAIKEYAKVEERDGKFETVIYGDDGVEMLSRNKDKATQPMGLRERIELMKSESDYAFAFGGSGQAGSGSQNSTGGTGGASQIGDDVSAAQRLSMGFQQS